MLMKAFGDSGLTVDFYAFNGANQVWDPTAAGGDGDYVAWVNANFVQYRIPNIGTETAAGRYVANAPNIEATRFETWIRAGALDTDNLIYEEELYVQVREEDSEFGEEAVNHDTGPDGELLVDYLQFTDGGVGVDDGDVRAYFKSDYDLGRVTREFIRSQTKTGVVNNGTNTQSGRMINPLYLTVGSTYTIVFNKPGSTVTQSVEIAL